MRGRSGKLVYCQIREIETVWDIVREYDASGKNVIEMPVRFRSTIDEFKNSGFQVSESGWQVMKITLRRSK